MADLFDLSNATDLDTKKLPIQTVNGVKPDANGNIAITNVANATRDSAGQQIDTTYIKNVTASNATITVTKGNGATSTATINNVANANKATADASGNTITTTYETKANAITGLAVSGRTITYTKGNGTQGTITTQDTNTTYSKLSQFTNDSGFITSSGSCASATKASCLDNYSNVGGNKIYLDWDNQVENYVGLKVDSTDMGGLITTKNIGSQNVVHKTGDETIAGIKTFSDPTVSNKELQFKDTKYDWSDTSINTWCDAGHVFWSDITGTRRMHELVGANGGVWKKACYINENCYFSVDSNRIISFSGSTTFNGEIVVDSDALKHIHSNGVLYVHTLPKWNGELLGTKFVKGTNGWYRKHSDGFIEQFFYIDGVKTSEEKIINFHIPFTTIHYNVSVIGSRYLSSDPSYTDDLIFVTSDETVTYIKLFAYDAGKNDYSTTIKLYVCGY